MQRKLWMSVLAVISIPVFAWLSWNITSSSRVPYLFCAGCALLSWLACFLPAGSARLSVSPWRRAVPWLAGLCFGILCTAANFPFWLDSSTIAAQGQIRYLYLAAWLISASGTGVLCQYGIQTLGTLADRSKGGHRIHPAALGTVTAVLTGTLLLFLYFGCLRYTLPVSASVSGILEQAYTFTWPVFPGVMLKLIQILSFSGVSAGIMTDICVVIQIVLMAAAVGFASSSLQSASGKWWPSLVLILLFLALYPCWYYTWIVSEVLWMTLGIFLCAVALFRLSALPHHQISSWIALTAGMLLVSMQSIWGCWMLLAVGIFYLLFRVWKHPGTALGMAALSACMTGLFAFGAPILGMQGSYNAFLTVPLQQIARVAAAERKLDSLQTRTIAPIAPVASLKESYTYYNAQPILDLVQKNKGFDSIYSSFPAVQNVYLSTASQYPEDYFKAFVDQTAGYWNGGYHTEKLPENLLPVSSSASDPIRNTAVQWLRTWIGWTDQWLEPLVSMGFGFWMVLALWFYMISSRKAGVYSCFTVLLYMICTSLSASSYHIYALGIPMFAALPFLWMCAMCPGQAGNPQIARQDPDAFHPKPVSRRKQKKLESKTINGVPLGK